jgi:hypothetical protein
MKIRKYQAGALIYTPSPTGATAGASSTSSSSSSGTKSEKISGTVQKEIMELMKTDGLPSDVSKLLDFASKYLDKSSQLTNYSPFGGTDEDYDIKDYIKILRLTQEAKYNKEQFGKASEQITKEGAWDDTAIDSQGRIWVAGEKDGSSYTARVTPKEYYEETQKKDPKFRALTNAELMNIRSRYPTYGFDGSGMIEDMKGVVGMKSINDYIRNIIKDFEAKSTTTYRFKDAEGKTYKTEDLKDGMAALTAGGPSGYYKITNKSKVNAENVQDALSYIWGSLGREMQNTLKAKMTTEGMNPSSPKDIQLYIANALDFGTLREYSEDFDSTATKYDPDGTGKKGGTEKASSEAMFAQDYVSRFATLDLPDGGYDTIVPHAAKINDTGAMLVKVKKGGIVRDKNQKGIQNVTIAEMMNEAEFAQAIDPENVSFGNKVLSSTDLKKIAFQGGSVNVAMLPYKTDDATGKLVPDFDLLNGFNQIQDILAKKKITSGFRFAEECKKRGIDPSKLKYDEKTNTCTIKETMAFAYVVGMAGDQTLDLTDDNKRMLSKVDGPDKDEWADIYNRIIKYNELGVGKTSKKVNTFDTSGKRHIYEGRVYFAMPNAGLGLLMSDNGQFRTKSEFTDVVAKQKLNEYELARLRQLQEEDPDYEYNRQTLGQWR